MSTRCQIAFYDEEEKDLRNFRALIYRHSDGYPDSEHGVLAAILPFLRWWAGTRGIADIDYCSARLLQYLCNRYDGRTMEMLNEATKTFEPEDMGQYTGTLGHGISQNFHGDIEYLYAVRPSKVSIYKVKRGDWWDASGKEDANINEFVELEGAALINLPAKDNETE